MLKTVPEYDLVIIGGGINGAGIARDAALRGLSVILFDKSDFGSGTSSWSSRLIHGGLRYLEYAEISLVYESLHERICLRNIASHLVKRIRINIPVYENSKRGLMLIRLGMIAYDLLSIRKTLPRHRMLNRDELLEQEPGLNAAGLRGGAQYNDAQVTFAERLVLENIISAAEAGAVVKNYSPVDTIGRHDGTAMNVGYVDADSGEKKVVKGRIVINASGPWVDRVLQKTGRQTRRLMGGTKGSHIIVGEFKGAPRDAFYVEAVADGRPFFIIPWNGQYLIGTTDIRYGREPDAAHASRKEIRYLLDETNRVFPEAELESDDIHFAYAGVRPLPRRGNRPESAITRRHIIKRHRRPLQGIISIIGGKLTTFRNLAEQTIDRVDRKLDAGLPRCITSSTLLPGAVGVIEARERLEDFAGLSERGRERIVGIYGGRATLILDLAAAEAGLSKVIDAEKSVLAAEVVFAIRHEYAKNLTDLMQRRLMLGLSADQGEQLIEAVATIAAAEFQWDEQELEMQIGRLREYNARLKVE
ncbi:MAG: glycerol-3-phosphate dehydrogenase [Woeseiaceae bacterium]